MTFLHRILTVSLLIFSLASAFPKFREAPAYRNGIQCPKSTSSETAIHIAMTLDATYLRGSLAGVLSVLHHAACPEHIFFHFLATRRRSDLHRVILSAFPYLSFRIYPFDAGLVRDKISVSVRRALDQPLNYARIYLADSLPEELGRVIYLDSDLIVVDDVAKLWYKARLVAKDFQYRLEWITMTPLVQLSSQQQYALL